MLHFFVLLPRNRNLAGRLRVEKDGMLLAEFSALGRGSRGPGDTSLLKDGNTPTGSYKGSEFIETKGRNLASYGPWGALRLKPESGNAVLAQDVFGRKGLLIHGGALATSGLWKGKLKPTHGCIRLSNSDMKRLREIIEAARYDDIRKMCREIEINVTVKEK
jgi:hypothetical protein